MDKVEFYETTRHGIKCKKSMNRISKSDKHLFDFSVNLFNNLPQNVRNECNLRKYINLLNNYFN